MHRCLQGLLVSLYILQWVLCSQQWRRLSATTEALKAPAALRQAAMGSWRQPDYHSSGEKIAPLSGVSDSARMSSPGNEPAKSVWLHRLHRLHRKSVHYLSYGAIDAESDAACRPAVPTGYP